MHLGKVEFSPSAFVATLSDGNCAPHNSVFDIGVHASGYWRLGVSCWQYEMSFSVDVRLEWSIFMLHALDFSFMTSLCFIWSPLAARNTPSVL